jgi:DNA-binding NarL/FixJ family response regulator
MRILVVDDHNLFRQSLKGLLSARGHSVVGEARNGREAVALALQLRPDLVLMDLAMPELDGVGATKAICSQHPEMRVVILTASEDDASLFEAIRGGACGFLVKTVEAEQFFRMLEGVAEGQPALSPSLARRLLRELARPETKAPDALSDRELEILRLLAGGMSSNQTIAERVNLSPNTVKFHVHNILEKLHLKNRAEAVAFALRNRLVPLPKADTNE